MSGFTSEDAGPESTQRWAEQSEGEREGVGPQTATKALVMQKELAFKTHYELVFNRYLTLDFGNTNITNNEVYIIPYQCLYHWLSGSDQGASNNNLTQMINLISGPATWIKIKKLEMAIDLQAVTRERLLQGTDTNTITKDFEDGQNMIIGVCNRRVQNWLMVVTAAQANLTGIGGLKASDTSIYTTNDHVTKYQLATRNTWKHTIDFTKHKNVTYKVPIDMMSNTSYLIPGVTLFKAHNTTVGSAYTSGWDYNSKLESYVYTRGTAGVGDGEWSIGQDTFVDAKNHPMIFIGQPKIPDETGYMKFTYTFNYRQKMIVEMGSGPDVEDPGSTLDKIFRNREQYDLPRCIPTTEEAPRYEVLCTPYSF